MHSQTVSQSAFSSRSQRQSAKTHRQVYGLPCCYRQLQPDFHQLSQFEPVSDRLQKSGLVFEGAIALYPSNPRYLNQTACPVIIPSQEEGDIRVLLHRPFSQIQVCVRSLGEVTLSALDVRGHCIAQGHTQDFAAQHPGQSIPAVWLTVTANQMASLIIGAKAPFVVEALQLRYQ